MFLLPADNYRDDGTIPPWAKYKVHIPVYRNRSIEVRIAPSLNVPLLLVLTSLSGRLLFCVAQVTAQLFDSKLNSLRNFTVSPAGPNFC